MEEKWNYIKKAIENNEIDHVVEICNGMSGTEKNIVEEKLIQELRCTDKVHYRNMIALILGDLGCDKAIDLLIELILDPPNKNCRGTLISALEGLKCEHKLIQLMHILADSNYEVKWKMYALLSEKIGVMSETDKLGCIDILKEDIDKLEEALGCMEDILYNRIQDRILLSKFYNIFMYED